MHFQWKKRRGYNRSGGLVFGITCGTVIGHCGMVGVFGCETERASTWRV